MRVEVSMQKQDITLIKSVHKGCTICSSSDAVYLMQTTQQKEHFKAMVKTGLYFDKAKKSLDLKNEDK